MAELRKEINEKFKRLMREGKNSRRTQSIPSRKVNGPTTSIIETPKHINNDDGEMNVSDTENQENRIQKVPFRPSETNELRTPIQPIFIQNRDLDDTVIIKENRERKIITDFQRFSGQNIQEEIFSGVSVKPCIAFLGFFRKYFS